MRSSYLYDEKILILVSQNLGEHEIWPDSCPIPLKFDFAELAETSVKFQNIIIVNTQSSGSDTSEGLMVTGHWGR